MNHLVCLNFGDKRAALAAIEWRVNDTAQP